MRRTVALIAFIALAACGSEPGPGGATTGEAKALDDAAAMIEAKRLPDSALRPSAAQSSAPQPAASGAPAQ